MSRIGIYIITNTINNKVYIGRSNNIRKRFGRHLNTLLKNIHHNHHLQRAFNKYGKDAFIFNILENCKAEEVEHKENYWINYYQSYKKESGYNIKILSEHINKYKILETKLNKLFDRFLINIIKKEHIEKRYKKIYQFDYNGIFLKRWNSAKDLELALNVSKGIINKACIKGNKIKGYQFRYTEKCNTYNNKRERKVIKITPDKEVTIYNSIAEAARNNNLDPKSIQNYLKGKVTTDNKWRYYGMD